MNAAEVVVWAIELVLIAGILYIDYLLLLDSRESKRYLRDYFIERRKWYEARKKSAGGRQSDSAAADSSGQSGATAGADPAKT